MKRSVGLFLFPLVLILLAAGSLFLVLNLQGSLDAYRPAPVAGAVTGGSAEAPLADSALSDTVVLVVIDGLREDASRSMPYLNQLRQQGANGTIRTGQPSYSKPSYAVLSTGAWQENTGIVLNSSSGPVSIDTVFRSARRNGLVVTMAAHEWWEEVNGREAFDSIYKYNDDDAHDPAGDAKVRDNAVRSLKADGPDLALVHFCQVDTQGHEAGAGSKAYRDAALAIDGYLQDIVAAMDLGRQTLIVTADHGHLARNNGGGSGHGGWEPELTTVPLVMVGAGVKGGTLPADLRQADVAPTVAALLGIAPPAHSRGRIIWEGLKASDQYRATLELAAAKAQFDTSAAYIRSIGAAPAVSSRMAEDIPALALPSTALAKAVASFGQGQYTEAFTAAAEARQASLAAAAAARAARIRNAQLPRVAIVVLIAALAIWLGRRLDRTLVRLVLASAAGYVLVYWLVYSGLFGDTFSIAVFPDAELLTFIRILGFPAFISLLILYLVLARGRTFQGRGGLVLAVEAVTAGAVLALLVVVAISYAINGLVVTWYLPDFRIGFLQMSALLQLGLIGLVAWIPAVLAAIPGAAGRKARGA